MWWLGAANDLKDRGLKCTDPAGIKPIEVDEWYQINAIKISGFPDVCIDLLGEKGSPVLLSVDNVGLVDVLPKSRG